MCRHEVIQLDPGRIEEVWLQNTHVEINSLDKSKTIFYIERVFGVEELLLASVTVSETLFVT